MSTPFINPFQMAQQQFDHVADLLNLDPAIREFLRWPQREFHFRIPVKMDNGETKIFQGYRVQHNDARGLIKAVCVFILRRRSIPYER
jgi:glutamate dehydrogenase (NAD(P)+)